MRSSATSADAVLLCTGGYSNVYFLSTNAKGCNVTAVWRAHKRGAGFANPCYTQIHPTCIPQSGDYQSKLTLMSESLRNDGRVWVPKAVGRRTGPAATFPRTSATTISSGSIPSFGNLVPRDVASRNAKNVCDEGRGVGPGKRGVYLDFDDAIESSRRGRDSRPLRQPLRHVRDDHRRKPLRGADADLPGAALHDGRSVGRLLPA